jgi:predicted RNA-binding Zn-ribbon protein involved in translation (DUF1610 family)
MFALADILALLDHWPKWKKIQETPERLEALTNRVAELEKRLSRRPGDACPGCGELAYRTISSQPHPFMGGLGAVVRKMKCESCGFTEEKTITPE